MVYQPAVWPAQSRPPTPMSPLPTVLYVLGGLAVVWGIADFLLVAATPTPPSGQRPTSACFLLAGAGLALCFVAAGQRRKHRSARVWITQQILVNATPDDVFTAISRPARRRLWWPDDALGEITVVETYRPYRFSFRWCSTERHSLLVVFDVAEVDDGTEVHVTEWGFEAMGWRRPELEEEYRKHDEAWDLALSDLREYVEQSGRR
ncbi:SRPBCC domain-containing protein [Cryptosporangium sp. NPDC048952]|uniref:SRPBCC domain-containing protein n=1 Tax=Cryptosporangium sp. NPDC048952 TaxID=3363961 RepID=UPI003721CD9F